MHLAGVNLDTMREVCLRVRWPKGKAVLFGTSTKVEKGDEQGVLTTVHYGAPATQLRWAGVLTQCPNACKGCIRACLGHTAGRMVYDSVRNAQNWKTLFVFYDRPSAHALARKELRELRKRAEKLGKQAAARWNGTTDDPWFADLLETDGVQLYDYTKNVQDARLSLVGDSAVHRTLSYSGANLTDCLKFLRLGGTVAVVFRTRNTDRFPDTWHGFPVLNGDETDIRYRDPPGHVVALTAKGTAMKDNTGWVEDCE